TVNFEIEAKCAEEWDLEDGRRYAARCTRRVRRLVVHTSLPPSGSRAFVFPNRKDASLKPRREGRRVRTLRLPDRWDIQLTEPNALVLDRPRWRIAGGKWQGPTEILRLDNRAREKMAWRRRGYSMVQPWAQEPNPNPETVTLELSYSFAVKDLPSGELHLAIETPEEFAISLNGADVETDADGGWWVDKSIRRIELPPGALKVGKNRLNITCHKFHTGIDLEQVFLLGNFGVKVAGADSTIVDPPAKLRVGNWVRQGLPFYSASVVYRTTLKARLAKGERAILALPRWKGTCVVVWVGGKPVGTLGWPPYEIDITDALGTASRVELGIEVIGSRRNAFGPLHQADPESAWTGPGEYRLTGKWWTEEYNLKPCGLLERPVVKIVR
ncbi:MAG: hypothetical protein QGD94_10485, partial [Planctomycetia bacterium]|nr:hypothetical protein [Planctomycetia bacterium]